MINMNFKKQKFEFLYDDIEEEEFDLNSIKKTRAHLENINDIISKVYNDDLRFHLCDINIFFFQSLKKKIKKFLSDETFELFENCYVDLDTTKFSEDVADITCNLPEKNVIHNGSNDDFPVLVVNSAAPDDDLFI